MVNNYNNWKLIAVGSIAAILFVGTLGLSSMSRQVDYEQIVSNSKAFAEKQSENVIITWNELALDTVHEKKLGSTTAARLYAMVNIAMYDAVNGIDRADGSSTLDSALVSPGDVPSDADRRAAAIAAAHAVLSAEQADREDIYDVQMAADLDAIGDDDKDDVEAGLSWGSYVGQQVVELRADDGSSPKMVEPGRSGVGEFQSDFTSAHNANMRPFAIADPLIYRSAGPPPLDSEEYANAFNEVKELGNLAIPDQKKEEIFRFWKGGSGSSRSPGEWIKIAIIVANQQDLSLSESARLFALLGMAMGDSVRVTWDDKLVYFFWRPQTAIRNADTDGNPDTEKDPNWEPRNAGRGPSPEQGGGQSMFAEPGGKGGSPEHVAGQSVFAGAGSTILAGFFGWDDISFTFEGDNAIAGPRTFESFSDAAQEAGRARIFAGIHFEFSNQEGQEAGRSLANEILATKLVPDPLKVRVHAKQIKDLIIVRLRNIGDSTVSVDAFTLTIGDSMLKAAKALKKWEKEGELNTVTFSGSKHPLQPDDKQYFLLKVDSVKPVVDWEVIGMDIDMSVKGSVTPLIR